MSGKLKTSYDDDPLMYGFFIGCVRWALGKPEIMARYQAESGDQFQPALNSIERMIDKVTGNNLAFLQCFSDWVEINLFGTREQVYGEGE